MGISATRKGVVSRFGRPIAGTKPTGEVALFSLHPVWSVAGNSLYNVPDTPKAAISAMLAHADDDDAGDKLVPTTKAFYLRNQKITLKSLAMEAWSESPVRAAEKADGSLPCQPSSRRGRAN